MQRQRRDPLTQLLDQFEQELRVAQAPARREGQRFRPLRRSAVAVQPVPLRRPVPSSRTTVPLRRTVVAQQLVVSPAQQPVVFPRQKQSAVQLIRVPPCARAVARESNEELSRRQAALMLDFASRSFLALAYLIIPGNEDKANRAARMSRQELQSALLEQIRPDLQQYHAPYLASLDAASTTAVQEYQTSQENVNRFLREHRVEPFMGGLQQPPLDVNLKQMLSDPEFVLEQASEAARKNLLKQIDARASFVQTVLRNVAALQSTVLNAPPLPEGEQWPLYRGVRAQDLIYALDENGQRSQQLFVLDQLGLEPGQRFEAMGFNSFSSVPWVALNFMGNASCCLYRLNMTSDVPGLIYPLNNVYKEFEVLLPPGEFQVDARTELTSALSDAIRITVYDLSWVGPLAPQVLEEEQLSRALQQAGDQEEEDEPQACQLL